MPDTIRLTIPLNAYSQTGPIQLANVRYRWIVQGVEQPQQDSGISQPDPNFPFFEFSCVPPDNADEIIAYDVTDLSNWNPGGWLRRQQALIVTPPPISIRAPTITFRQVYEAILRRLGYNPKGDAVKEDVAQNILVHINDRVRFVWSIWDWPQINLVEWRALRTVWTPSITFEPGDELYYFGTGVGIFPRNIDPPPPGEFSGYYTCILENTGRLPSNPTYYEPLTLKDRYILYEQSFENPIGEMLDVYKDNPREHLRTKILNSYPSSKGIDLRGTSPDIVWIRFRVPCPQFTLRPLIGGNTDTGTPFYDPDSGNCWYFSGDEMNPKGALIPFPLFISGYVKPAAFSDCLLETAMEAQTKLTIASQAMDEAMQYLAREIDNLSAQGQRMYYPAFPQQRRHYGRGPGLAAGAVPTEAFGGVS